MQLHFSGSSSSLHFPPLRCEPWDLATARLVPPLPGGNGLLGFGRFLNAVVNCDRDDNENPHGEDSHPGNRFGNQARQQNPSPAKKQEQEESGSQIERPRSEEHTSELQSRQYL